MGLINNVSYLMNKVLVNVPRVPLAIARGIFTLIPTQSARKAINRIDEEFVKADVNLDAERAAQKEQESIAKAKAETQKATAKARSTAVQREEKQKTHSNQTIVQHDSGLKIKEILGDTSQSIQTNSLKSIEKQAKNMADFQSGKLNTLTKIETHQETASKVQKIANQKEAIVDKARITMNKEGVSAAEAHLTALDEVHAHERKGAEIQNRITVKEVRQNFAVQIIDKLSGIEMRQMALQNELQNQGLDNKQQLDETTAIKKQKLQGQIEQLKSEKQQYLHGVAANLSKEELTYVASYMTDHMQATSFKNKEQISAELRSDTETTVKEATLLAGKRQVSEKEIVQTMSKNEKSEQTHRIEISQTLEQNDNFKSSLGESINLLNHAAQTKPETEKTGQQEKSAPSANIQGFAMVAANQQKKEGHAEPTTSATAVNSI